jgi:carboxymethylenebutenolidase
VFYGGGAPLTDESVSQITAPFLGLYGEEDHGIPVETVHANEAKLRAHHKVCEFVIYPGAPHAFFNDERPSYRPDASEDAWKRTLAWFRQYLKA